MFANSGLLTNKTHLLPISIEVKYKPRGHADDDDPLIRRRDQKAVLLHICRIRGWPLKGKGIRLLHLPFLPVPLLYNNCSVDDQFPSLNTPSLGPLLLTRTGGVALGRCSPPVCIATAAQTTVRPRRIIPETIIIVVILNWKYNICSPFVKHVKKRFLYELGSFASILYQPASQPHRIPTKSR